MTSATEIYDVYTQADPSFQLTAVRLGGRDQLIRWYLTSADDGWCVGHATPADFLRMVERAGWSPGLGALTI